MDQELAKLVVKLALDAKQYSDQLAQSAKQTADWASNVTRHANQGAGAFGNAIGPIGKLTGALGSMAVVAGGIIAANIFGQIAGGLSSFVSTGIQAVATAQTLQMGMEALLASNNMYEKSVEQVTVATTKQLMTTAEYSQKEDELFAKMNLQMSRINEQKEGIRQLTAQWGENGLAVLTAKDRLAQMETQLRGTEADINSLTQSETKYSTATKTTYNQVMNMADAQRLAAQQSKELLGFVEQLAVVSPFEQEQVAMVAKYAIAAGLATDDAKGFTTGFLDLSAAVGISSESLAFAADQLLQVSKVGKLTEIDLRQLRRLGIDLEKIIGVEMGMSIEEFNAKAGESPEIFNELFNSVAKFSKNTFGGTVERMASSVDGMKSTLKDLFTVGSRKFFQPIIEAVTPAAQDIIGKMTDFILGGGGMSGLGEKAAEFLTSGIAKGMKVVSTFKAGGLAIFSEFLDAQGVTLWFKLKDLFKSIGTTVAELGKAFGLVMPSFEGLSTGGMLDIIIKGVDLLNQGFQGIIPIIRKVTGFIIAFQAGGLFGSRTSDSVSSGGLLAALGIPPDIITTIQTIFDQVTTSITNAITFVSDAITAFQGGGLFGSRSGSFGSVGLLAALGVPPDIISVIQSTFNQITEAVNAFMTGGIFGTLMATPGGTAQTGGLLRALGLSDETVATIQTTLTQITSFVTDHFGELQGAIIGIGAAIAGVAIVGTIVSLGVAIAGLVTPIGLIIAGAALLGAAWAGNWGGIQEKTLAVWSAIMMFTGFLTGTVFPLFMSFIQTYIDVTSARLQVLSDTWTGYLLPALTAVWEFIDQSLMPLWTSVINLFGAVGKKALEAWAGLWKNLLLPALTKVWDFIDANIMPMFASIGEAVDEKVGPPMARMTDDIFPAFEKGLNAIKKVIQDVTGFFNGLATAVKNFELPAVLQPGSPPPFAIALQDIAKAAGLATGAIDNMAGSVGGGNFQAAYDKLFGVVGRSGDIHGIIGAARDDLEDFFDMAGVENSKSALALKNLNTLFHQNADEILSATDRAAAFEAVIERQARNGFSFGFLTEGGGADILSDAVKTFIGAFDQRKKEMGAALQAAIVMASRKAVELAGKLNDFAMSAAGRVTQQVDSLYAMLQTNATQFDWEGQIISATEAQELYNNALSEQLAAQKEIAQLQKNQADLAFLQQQLDLMEQARAAGLNMADIFGGLEFGLNASLPDLIAATNAVVQAMIDQVNSDLGIHSESTVMKEKGRWAMAGLAQGIKDAVSLPVGAMGGAVQQVTNNAFTQNIFSGTGPGNAAGEFSQMRARFST